MNQCMYQKKTKHKKTKILEKSKKKQKTVCISHNIYIKSNADMYLNKKKTKHKERQTKK